MTHQNKTGKTFSLIHRMFPKAILIYSLSFLSLVVWALRLDRLSCYSVLLASIPIGAMALSNLSALGWNGYALYFCLLSLSLWHSEKKKVARGTLFRWVVLPSLISGGVAAFSSALGIANAQVGLVPAVICSLLVVFDELNEAQWGALSVRYFVVSLPIVIGLFYSRPIWDETAVSTLTSRVDQGPYRGLFTSPEKKQFLDDISGQLVTALKSKGPLLIYPNFTAGYLIAQKEPASGILWYSNPGGEEGRSMDAILAKAYQKDAESETYLLRMKVWYAHPKLQAANIFLKESPINQLIEKKHQPILDTQWFTLFQTRSIEK